MPPDHAKATRPDAPAVMFSDSENEYDEQEHDQDSITRDEEDMSTEPHPSTDGAAAQVQVKREYDPKDPMRPRRKKARRACGACQRAHLTCSDERPCYRCIKRNLADSCQDGVRKKAKYLHDAPAEALRPPVLGANFNPVTPSAPLLETRRQTSQASETPSNVGAFFPQTSAPQYPMYAATQTALVSMPESMPFTSRQAPVSPSFQGPSNAQMGLAVPPLTGDRPDFASFFDPSNAALFNFNVDGLNNFGSQYGAMEWGMLGHMSSAAAETPPQDATMPQPGAPDANFGSAGHFGNRVGQYDKAFENNVVGDFPVLDQHVNGYYSQGNLQHALPHAYAIAAGPRSLQSPSTENDSPQPATLGFEESPKTANYSIAAGPAHAATHQPRSRKQASLARPAAYSILGRRQRDPSFIYDMVKEPFPYVKSFHKLIDLLKYRLSTNQIVRVARSLASIRPSFITCTRTLNSQDLVFMEKSFQRALFEYEEFMHHCPSPVLICRRTGEVAGVNKAFTAVTGWTKNVLLGKEPNLNVNTGSVVGSAAGSVAGTTPNLGAVNEELGKLAEDEMRPVFIAELLDNDSIVEFYEDFSQLAFNDSRGTPRRTGRLFKYRSPDSTGSGGPDAGMQESPQKTTRSDILSNRVAKIDGEHGISRLEKDGKHDCAYTWTIKRDTFDIPMMIVINFLPILPANGGKLAV